MTHGMQHMDSAATDVVDGEIEDGVVGLTEGKIEVQAGAAVIKSADEQLDTLVDLILR